MDRISTHISVSYADDRGDGLKIWQLAPPIIPLDLSGQSIGRWIAVAKRIHVLILVVISIVGILLVILILLVKHIKECHARLGLQRRIVFLLGAVFVSKMNIHPVAVLFNPMRNIILAAHQINHVLDALQIPRLFHAFIDKVRPPFSSCMSFTRPLLIPE